MGVIYSLLISHRSEHLYKTDTLTDYDRNANHYDQYRRPSPIIQEHLLKFFSGTQGPILSIGCGTGRMENAISDNINIFGLDRSDGMLAQARNRIHLLTQGDMKALPYVNGSFNGLYFMQSLHHIGANLDIKPEVRNSVRKVVLREAYQVLNRGSIVIIQRDPLQNQAVWFWRFFPQALETKLKIQPKVSDISNWLKEIGFSNVTSKPINDPMAIYFYDPNSPLDPKFRRSFSDFSYLSEEDVTKGVNKLKIAIKNGTVMDEINRCKDDFNKIGGTVFLITAEKL